ncbi:MAG: metallophosphoesterase [Sediminibacterium sp.]|jgi:3',5'-cyclic AMP phosphodiesterase CpdA|nr:metallophosphoesterase [Sediminibacterium sp.]
MKRNTFLKLAALGGLANVVNPQISTATNLSKRKRVRMAFVSDIHIKPTEHAEKGFRAALKSIHTQKEIDFVMNGGDSIMDALNASREKVSAQWELWHRILKEENTYTWYHCLGNHDAWGWQMKDVAVRNDALFGKQWALKELQMEKAYYAFTQKNWKFIVLDSAQENNGGYIARIDAEQWSWLEQELAQTPVNLHICIVCHIPIVSFCSALFSDKNEANGDWRISRALLHVDARQLIDLFAKYPMIKCCLSGHIHLQDAVHFKGIQYYCNGAVSGNWWNGSFKGFAPAYALFDFMEDGSVHRELVSYTIGSGL